MTLRFTKKEKVDNIDYAYDRPGWHNDSEGGNTHGWVTVEVRNLGVFGEAVHALVHKKLMGLPTYTPQTGPGTVYMTTIDRWSGYSEYTVTDTWQEVVITCPLWGKEYVFKTPAYLYSELLELGNGEPREDYNK